MYEENNFDLCEALIARIARCKKGTYAIISSEGKPNEMIVCGNRLRMQALWVKQGDSLWTTETFKGNLIMRSGRPGTPGEFYLGDSNWVHLNSSVDSHPDILCIALVTLPMDTNTIIGLKGVYNAECATAYMVQDPALVDVLLWEGRQLEKTADMISGGYINENQIIP